MSGVPARPIVLVSSVSFVSADLAANLAAREFRGVNVRVSVPTEDRVSQFVELVDPALRRRDALGGRADDVRCGQRPGNSCRGQRAGRRLREGRRRDGGRISAQEHADAAGRVALTEMDVRLERHIFRPARRRRRRR